MMEAEQPGMKTKAVQGVVAIAIFRITTDRMAHIRRMYADLILTTCFELELHEGMVSCAG